MPSDLTVAERGAWRPTPAVRMAPRRPERTAWLTERAAALLLPLVVPAVLLALWQLSATLGWVSVQVLPPPALVAQTLFDLLWSGDISGNLWISLRRILSGFLIGGLAGMALGVAMGLSPRVEHYLSPLFRAVAQVPSLGWLPFLILLVGIGEPLKFLIIAKACFVPMALNSFEGIRNIPPSFLEVARVFRLSRRALVLKVVLPRHPAARFQRRAAGAEPRLDRPGDRGDARLDRGHRLPHRLGPDAVPGGRRDGRNGGDRRRRAGDGRRPEADRAAPAPLVAGPSLNGR
ncbi:membrane protein of unknown function [Azospirillum baldaniorum]|uniref:ABC transmembrane type-1 domain-containing protein n=1 Tax=Azospirillum baldaniorum TaxID=1064539 RepID=A0A9P1JT05_9PROT|nr:ABC transporter permease [Azospirillum baldaniorum]CCC99215.1 membrane protein of unknown function [Azospirillum baldaniorum]